MFVPMMLVCVVAVGVGGTKYQNVIDMDDILAPEFMPGSLLMLENPEQSAGNITNGTSSAIFLNQTLLAGSVQEALSTMDFHRSMMNEYLCRNFIAEQILDDLSLTRFRRRSGKEPPKRNNNHHHSKITVRDNLIDDEGSKNYKSWLSKSTTLEDIYKHYQQMEDKSDEVGEVDKDGDAGKDSGEYETYHQVPIGPEKLSNYPSSTGYAYAPATAGHAPVYAYGHGWGQPFSHSYGFSGPAISHPGDDIGHIHIHTDPSPPKWHGSHDSGKKDMTELFDIALTSLAYLSFGLFMVHVVACIAQSKKQRPTVIYSYVPILSTTTTAGTVMGGGGMAMAGNQVALHANPDDIDYQDEELTEMGMSLHDGADVGDVGMHEAGGVNEFGDGQVMYVHLMGGGGDGGEVEQLDEGRQLKPATTTTAAAGRRRRRRAADVPNVQAPSDAALNELARHVLTSIEAALVAHQDNGTCLRKYLCANNKFSRGLANNNKVWLPVWSLGMSWLSGKLAPNVPVATSMLDSLKASILGLGNADCEVIYQDCNLRQERDTRRKRRRK